MKEFYFQLDNLSAGFHHACSTGKSSAHSQRIWVLIEVLTTTNFLKDVGLDIKVLTELSQSSKIVN